MGKRGENIRKRKDGRWEARICITSNDIKKYHSIYARTYKEVKEKRKMYFSDYSVSSTPTNNSKSKTTVETLLEIWLLEKEMQLKKSTILKYRNIISSHILPKIGNIKLNEITCDTINSFLLERMSAGRKSNGKNLSGSYIKTMSKSYYHLHLTMLTKLVFTHHFKAKYQNLP